MITLYAFGPNFGLPDASPFCMKVLVLLRMAGLDHTFKPCDLRKAPKGKGPYITDDGVTIADSTFIRWHLEKKHGADFDAGLNARQRAEAWAFEKLCEDNLYWAVVSERWLIDENFNAGPRAFFNAVPAPMRPMVSAVVRRQIRRALHGQGLGRHSREERIEIARRGIDALSDKLGENAFFMGDKPTSVDAIVFSTVAGYLPEVFETELKAMVRRHDNLMAYHDRCMSKWFPKFSAASGSAASGNA